jgi:hypothetical protein
MFGVRRRAEHLFERLDILKQARAAGTGGGESQICDHSRLRQIPCIGPIRSALLAALIQTPHRFRASCGDPPSRSVTDIMLTAKRGRYWGMATFVIPSDQIDF